MTTFTVQTRLRSILRPIGQRQTASTGSDPEEAILAGNLQCHDPLILNPGDRRQSRMSIILRESELLCRILKD